jgi:hypothetical protein
MTIRKSVVVALAIAALGAVSPARSQAVKWHPGHYALLNAGETIETHLKRIDQIGNEPSIQGVMVRLYWAEMETSKGVYDLSKIDLYLQRLRVQPAAKRLFLLIMERRYTPNANGIVPSYLTSERSFHGGLIATRVGYTARLWDAPVMGRLIMLYKVIGARYDADPNFEGIATGETTLSLATPYPAGYSVEALAAQWQRLATSVRPSMKRTNLLVLTNWLGSPPLFDRMMQSFMTARVGVGAPDVIPTQLATGQEVWSGMHGADYRGTLPIGNIVDTPELGGTKGSWTPAQLHAFAYQTLRPNHLFWAWNTWVGDASQQWTTGILPFLRTHPPVHTKCPTAYGSCKQ